MEKDKCVTVVEALAPVPVYLLGQTLNQPGHLAMLHLHY